MIRALGACLGLALASTARAEVPCERLTAFIGQVWSDPVVLSQPLPGAQTCGVAMAPGGADEVHCLWDHPYRSAEANLAFDQLIGSIRRCFDQAKAVTDDLGVNHPDSYNLRRFLAAKTLLSVSLKDKAALGKTYVFIRAERRP